MPGGDAELTRAAQRGEVAALGLLLERHEAAMRAVALSILGPGPDAEDVVQDAALTALRSIGDVRDPDAVGAWLRTIVRNRCRGLLTNVAGDPDHCPPAVAWIMQLRGGRVGELRLHHSQPLRDFSAPAIES